MRQVFTSACLEIKPKNYEKLEHVEQTKNKVDHHVAVVKPTKSTPQNDAGQDV